MRAACSSPISRSRAGAKPGWLWDAPSTRSRASPATERMTASRCASDRIGRRSAPVAAPISSVSRRKVLMDAPRSAPLDSQSSRSNRAASSAVGTTRTGSRSSACSSRAWIAPARPEFGGPLITEIDIPPSIGRATAHSADDRGDSVGCRVYLREVMPLCFIDPADAIRAIADSVGREARRQLLGEAVRAWVDEIPDDELEAHYARAIAELDEHDISMLAAWHASMDVGHPVPNRDFLMGAFTALGQHRREALKLAAGFRGEEAVDRGVTEERALETVLDWLSPPRLMELAAEALELYVWDRAGSDN